jgi:sugar/nucleoside kinase (ribokinase family)
MLDVVVIIDSQINYGSDTPSSISTHGGGAAANTASWLAYSGNQVFFVARTGDDAAADAVTAELDFWGVSHKDFRQAGLKTGVVVVIVDETGQRTMFPDSGANSGLDTSDLPELTGFDAAFISGYSLFNKASSAGVQRMIQEISAAGIPIFFDPASVGTISHFGKDKALAFLPLMNFVLLNEEEALYLSGAESVEKALSFLNQYCDCVIIKTGSTGAIGSTKNTPPIIAPTKAIKPIDTTGAGDAFAAGYISAWIETADLLQAMSKGNALAALCVANIGARPSVNPS